MHTRRGSGRWEPYASPSHRQAPESLHWLALLCVFHRRSACYVHESSLKYQHLDTAWYAGACVCQLECRKSVGGVLLSVNARNAGYIPFTRSNERGACALHRKSRTSPGSVSDVTASRTWGQSFCGSDESCPVLVHLCQQKHATMLCTVSRVCP